MGNNNKPRPPPPPPLPIIDHIRTSSARCKRTDLRPISGPKKQAAAARGRIGERVEVRVPSHPSAVLRGRVVCTQGTHGPPRSHTHAWWCCCCCRFAFAMRARVSHPTPMTQPIEIHADSVGNTPSTDRPPASIETQPQPFCPCCRARKRDAGNSTGGGGQVSSHCPFATSERPPAALLPERRCQPILARESCFRSRKAGSPPPAHNKLPRAPKTAGGGSPGPLAGARIGSPLSLITPAHTNARGPRQSLPTHGTDRPPRSGPFDPPRPLRSCDGACSTLLSVVRAAFSDPRCLRVRGKGGRGSERHASSISRPPRSALLHPFFLFLHMQQ